MIYMESMGAVVANKTEANIFVAVNGGSLWKCSWSGSQPSWTNHGLPEGTDRILYPRGATVIDGHRPYIFVEDGNDDTAVNWLSDKGTWNWSSLGKPELDIHFDYGAVTFGDAGPHVYFSISDGDLWAGTYRESDWAWFRVDRPPVALMGSMGTTVLYGNRPYIFVEGLDGNLWVYWTSDKGVASWFNLGKPHDKDVESIGSALAVVNDAPYVFFISDGRLWARFWNDHGWHWADLKAPNGLSIKNSMGATVAVNGFQPYVLAFVTCTDGNLWVNVEMQEKEGGEWLNQKRPDGVTLENWIGTVTLGANKVCVFIRGSDGNLWVNEGVYWHNLGRPPV